MCEAFGCLPSEAEAEDWRMVKAILDYRTLESAKAQHNADVSKMSEGQASLWGQMLTAIND